MDELRDQLELMGCDWDNEEEDQVRLLPGRRPQPRCIAPGWCRTRKRLLLCVISRWARAWTHPSRRVGGRDHHPPLRDHARTGGHACVSSAPSLFRHR
jgi:hypothetical protein